MIILPEGKLAHPGTSSQKSARTCNGGPQLSSSRAFFRSPARPSNMNHIMADLSSSMFLPAARCHKSSTQQSANDSQRERWRTPTHHRSERCEDG